MRSRLVVEEPGTPDERAAGVWWLWLVTGSAWLLFSVIVFRFAYSSVSAVSNSRSLSSCKSRL